MHTVQRQVYFVTGTDTHVGKTFISCLLLARACAQGHACFAMKPVSAGCIQDEQGNWRSEDAEQLKQYASVTITDELLAPIKLLLPTSPHIAAASVGERLQVARIAGFIRGGLATPASHVLVEGAGGWRVPINQQEYLSDVAKQLNLPVILVVGIRLGCLNHTLLTVEAILRDGLKLAGWVANVLQADEPFMAEQISTLKQKLAAPCLGVITYQPEATIHHLIEDIRWPAELTKSATMPTAGSDVPSGRADQ